RRKVEQIASSQAAVFHNERPGLERLGAEIAQKRATEQTKLGVLQAEKSKLRNAEDLATQEAEILVTQQRIEKLSKLTAEAEQRLADIHTGTQDWERIQELFDVANLFLSKSTGAAEASGERKVSGTYLPATVVPISRLAGNNWELVFKGREEGTFEEFLRSFAETVPQTRVVTMSELAKVFGGLQYSHPDYQRRRSAP